MQFLVTLKQFLIPKQLIRQLVMVQLLQQAGR